MHSTEPRLQIEEVDTAMLSGDQWRAVLQLCDEAYEEPTQQFFADVGPGRHFLGYADRNLVTHLMVVERSLQPAGDPALRTAYVELVATAPYQQGKGYASTLLRRLSTAFPDFDIAALSPSAPEFYSRLGWELWLGPLSTRKATGIEATPEEQVMILRLPRTPSTLDVRAALSVEWRPGEIW
jgi:predicted acetyltransferase